MENPNRFTHVLQSLGYTLTVSVGGPPYRFVLSSPDDVWVGVGAKPEHAHAEAIRQAFPSRGARALLEARLKEIADGPSNPIGEALFAVSTPSKKSSETGRQPREHVIPLLGLQVVKEKEKEKETPAARGPEVRQKDAAQELAQEAANATPRRDDQEEVSSVEQLHADRLQKAADMLDDDVLWTSPPSMIKVTVAHAFFCIRSAEDSIARRRLRDACEKVRQLASHVVSELWPGSVETLHRSAVPETAFVGLPPDIASIAPSSWEQAAVITHALLCSTTRTWKRESWKDDDAHVGHLPDGSDVEEVLRNMQAALRVVWQEEVKVKLSPEERDQVLKRAEAHVGLLAAGALQMRWIRCQVMGPQTEREWGWAFGRLRQIVSMARGDGWALALRNPIDPASLPSAFGHGTWAEAVGKDPRVAAARAAAEEQRQRAAEQKAARNAARHRLVAEVPVFGSAATLVEKWIEEVIPVMTNPEIAGVAYHLRPQILAIDPDKFEDRQVRSRLRRLSKYLHQQPEPETESDEGEEEDQGGPESPVIAKVRGFLRDKKVLFVTNRQDRKLQELLGSVLGISDLDFRDVSDPRRLQAAVNAVSVGDHDIVLLTTSFSSHTADHQLAKAAKKRKIPYVRVAKGRPLAVALAVVQTLGMKM